MHNNLRNRSTSDLFVADDLSLYPKEVLGLPYFHLDITNMQQVFTLVKPLIDKDGNFLLRKSFTKVGTLTVSVLHNRGLQHFTISTQNGQYFLKDKLFLTVRELVNHYKTNDVPNMERISGIRLKFPIIRSATVDGGDTDTDEARYVGKKKHSLDDTRGLSQRLPLPLPGSSFTLQVQPRCSASSNDFNMTRSDLQASRRPWKASLEEITPRGGREYHSALIRSKGQASLRGAAENLSYDASPSDGGSERPSATWHHPGRRTVDDTATMDADPYYSSIRNLAQDMSPILIEMLRSMESEADDRCICGLYLDEADLAMGWTMHLSVDAGTEGRLFFMGPEGETAWNLPLEVSIHLSTEQQDRIREIMLQHSSPRIEQRQSN